MKASDLMSTPVVSVGPDTHMAAILEILLDRRISGVFVVDAGKVVGSVGEGELLHRHEIGTQDSFAPKNWWWRFVGAGSQSASYVKTHGEYARDFMNRQVVPVSQDTPVAVVASIFNARHVRRIPVLRDTQLVGVITRADLIRALAGRKTTPLAVPETNDEAIRVRVLAELKQQPWWQSQASAVVVCKGLVRFVGRYESDDDRQAARVAAENIPGVRGVSDGRVSASDGESIV